MLFELLQGEVIRGVWKDEEVKEAMELCLSCKACKSECPANVDIATYKAEFLVALLRKQAAAAKSVCLWPYRALDQAGVAHSQNCQLSQPGTGIPSPAANGLRTGTAAAIATAGASPLLAMGAESIGIPFSRRRPARIRCLRLRGGKSSVGGHVQQLLSSRNVPGCARSAGGGGMHRPVFPTSSVLRATRFMISACSRKPKSI